MVAQKNIFKRPYAFAWVIYTVLMKAYTSKDALKNKLIKEQDNGSKETIRKCILCRLP